MYAIFSLHCIQDKSKNDPIMPQNILVNVINESFAILAVEECLVHIAFILPKIREVRPTEMTIQDIVELSLKIINNAYKLQSLTDRFYVLLIAFRKFVQCSLN